jgi:serine/threonine-protein kinase
MELDDLKQALQVLEQRVQQQSAFTLRGERQQTRDRMRAALWPLFLAHAAQIAVGLTLAFVVGPFWATRLTEPHLLVAGIALHAYAVLMIVLGARMLALLWRLDFAAPVVTIQQQLALVRRSYIRAGLVIGVPWWLLWMPLGLVLFEMGGVDLYPYADMRWLVANLVVGTAGAGVTLWLCRGLWYRPTDTAEARELEKTWGGRSLQNVQRFLDDLAEFAKE